MASTFTGHTKMTNMEKLIATAKILTTPGNSQRANEVRHNSDHQPYVLLIFRMALISAISLGCYSFFLYFFYLLLQLERTRGNLRAFLIFSTMKAITLQATDPTWSNSNSKIYKYLYKFRDP